MNWADTMKEHAELPARELASPDATVLPCEASTSWEPHEVWLTRVKLPRDRAALERGDT